MVCAKSFGAKDKEKIQKTVHTSLALAVVSGLILAFIGVVFARPLLQMINTPADVIDHSVIYMSLIFAGCPFSLVYNFSAGVLRAFGDTKRPLYILSVTGFVNVLLNLVFVIFLNMAVAGVALATVISQALSAGAAVYILMKSDGDIRLDPKKIKFHKEELFNIVKIGLPTGLNAVMYNVANVSLQSSINSFGKEYMAASTAGSAVASYINLPEGAFATAVVSFVGQNYGAKKYKRIHKVVGVALLATLLFSAVPSVFVTVFPKFFLGLFVKEPEVIIKGVGKVIIMGIGYLINIPVAIYGAALRGIERSNTPTVINLLTILVSRMAWIYFIFPLHPTFEMLFFCFPVSWIISSVALGIAYYLHMKKLISEK